MMDRNTVELYKKLYPAGTRIKLIHMDDPYNPVEEGTCGTVTMVDDAGTIHMRWDNRRSLGLCPEKDKFEVIGKESE